MSSERDEYLAVLKAVYDYEPTSEDELAIKEDQVLFLVERTDEEWWKVKHKPDSQDDETASSGLVPASYVEEAEHISVVKTLYSYDAGAPGELSVNEGETLFVYDKDEDWLLVKTGRDGGKVGYVPGNYVEESTGEDDLVENEASRIVIPDSPPQQPTGTYVDPADRVAAASDKIKADDIQTWSVSEIDKKGKKKKGTLGVGNGAIFFASESDKTPVQKWETSVIENIRIEKSKHVHLFIGGANPISLHFNAGNKDTADAIVKKLHSSKELAAGTSSSSPSTRTTSPPLLPQTPSPPPLSVTIPGAGTKPNKNGASVHFAQSPAVIPSPDTPLNTEPDEDDDSADIERQAGSALYDFTADGEDELSVKEGERLIILDKESSDEWWKCRNMDGAEGVVPASYIETIGGEEKTTQEEEEVGIEAQQPAAREEAERAAAEAEFAAAQARERAEKERERKKRDADRNAKAAALAAKAEKERRDREQRDREQRDREQRDREERDAAEKRLADLNKRNRDSVKSRPGEDRPSKRANSPEPQAKFPNAERTRIWHDHSRQWRTEAEFLGVSKGKIRLHKINGVIIEVPPEKMSTDDVRYIESITKQRLGGGHTSHSRSKDEDDVPLVLSQGRSDTSARPTPPPKKAPTIDWFEFFLNAGCELDDCTRYASSFERDKIDETILPDIKESTLRSLGLREGDIIRVMKVVEQRKPKSSDRDDGLKAQLARDEEIAKALQEEEYGGLSGRPPNTISSAPNLFAGPGGALKPRRGRPQPRGSAPPVNVDVNSIVSASDQISRAASPLVNGPNVEKASPAIASGPKRTASTQPGGFDDDAWTNRPSSTKPTAPTPTLPAAATPTSPPPAPPAPPAPTPSAPVPQSVTPAQILPPPSTSTGANTSTQASGQFEILAKIGQMRPAPATTPQLSMLGQSSPPVSSPPPQSFQSGLGMSNSPIPMGQHLQNLQAQQTGVYVQQAQNGPRGPLTPVPGNQSLLNPLIPTHTNFNQFVPTRPSSNPTLQPPVQNSYQPQGQPLYLSNVTTGFGQTGPLMPQQTGFPGMIPQQTGVFPGISSQPTGFVGNGFGGAALPSFMPLGGLGGTQPNPTTFNAVSQSSFNNGNLSFPPAPNLPKDHSPANVFAQMKSGTFGDESAPQPADKYDALRSQPAGFVYQQNGSLGGF